MLIIVQSNILWLGKLAQADIFGIKFTFVKSVILVIF